VHERHLEVVLERGHDLLTLVLAEQAVVDEHACQPIAQRTVDDQGGCGRVDPAGKAADGTTVADLLANQRDLLVDDRCRGPVAFALADVEEEGLQDVGAVRRVDYLGMELDAVQPAVGGLERGDGR
jgi:hypothetical protein